MSVSKTSRVQSSSPSIKRAYHSHENSSADVEKIDTTNKVLIKDENDFSGGKNKDRGSKEEEDKDFVSDVPIISNAINIQAQSQELHKDSKSAIETYEENASSQPKEDFDEFV